MIHIIPLILYFLAGAAWGVRETCWQDSDEWVEVLPDNLDGGINPFTWEWWDASVSWKNKYREGNPALGRAFFGSKWLGVIITDAYHLFQSIHTMLICLAIMVGSYLGHPPHVAANWQWVIYFVLITTAYKTGFTITLRYTIPMFRHILHPIVRASARIYWKLDELKDYGMLAFPGALFIIVLLTIFLPMDLLATYTSIHHAWAFLIPLAVFSLITWWLTKARKLDAKFRRDLEY